MQHLLLHQTEIATHPFPATPLYQVAEKIQQDWYVEVLAKPQGAL
jgi:hypothetical protein